MADTATFQEWLAYLGVQTQLRGAARAEVLEITGGDADAPLAVIKHEDGAVWSVAHERRIPRVILDANWRGLDNSETASVNLAQAASQLASGFPLVQADTRESDGDALLTLRAPLYADGLAAQAFLQTVSAVLKAAEAFDIIASRKADEVRAWAEFQALSEKRSAEQLALIDSATRVPATTPAPAAAAQPTATIPAQGSARQAAKRKPTSRRAGSAERSGAAEPAHTGSAQHSGPTFTVPPGGMSAWTSPDPNQKPTATLQPAVPLHLIERWGDWAHVLADNGWTGWVDARRLDNPQK